MHRGGVAMLGLLAVGACSDALEQTTSAGQVVVAVNTVNGTLSLVSVDNRSVSSVNVPPAGATPTSVATRGSLVVAPGGNAATLAVFDFSNGSPPAITTATLPANSGATGVAIQSDSIVWVANPNRNSVTRVNVRTGDTASAAVGVFPQAVVVVGGLLYVVNANVVGGTPAGPSWITVLRTATPSPAFDSIPLTGKNARSATLGADGRVYVVNAGTLGGGDGTLSIVDTSSRIEAAVLNGLGESPGPAVYHPSGRLLVASPTEGILEVSAATRTLTRGTGQGVKPGGRGVAALALDQTGRIYAFDRGNCTQPGVLHILTAPPSYDAANPIAVGVCPSAAATILVPSL